MWLNNSFEDPTADSSRPRPIRRRSSPPRLHLEALEGRRLLSYSVTDLGTLGGSSIEVQDINSSGQVVGISARSDDNRHAFLWQNGVMTDLGTLGGAFSFSRANAISDAGQIVGSSYAADGWEHAFLLTPEDTNGNGAPDRWFRDSNSDGKNDLMLDLGPDRVANDLNNAGQVVGSLWAGSYRAFLWQNGVTTVFETPEGNSSYANSINDAGQVTGFGGGILWQGGVTHFFGRGGDINQSGQFAAGGGWLAGDALLWTPTTPNGATGSFTSLGNLGVDFYGHRETAEAYSVAAGLNDFGTVVGSSMTLHSYSDPDGGYTYTTSRGFVWADGVMQDLGGYGAAAINNAGQIVGVGPVNIDWSSGERPHGFLLTPLSGVGKSWVGPASGGNWSTAANWSPAGVPGASDFVTISGKSVNLSASATVAGLNLFGGATLTLAANGNRVLRTSSLPISSNSKLNLNDNDLILDYRIGGEGGAGAAASPLGSWNGSAYSGVLGQISRGHNHGAWDGGGLVTTRADAISGLTTLGVGEAANLLGITGAQTALFSGQTVDATTVLVKYTFGGDANLDGFVSADDYSAIDFNVGVARASGWHNGDFNYDGFISADDYSAIDFMLVAQGGPL